jgi:hypothetical protein
MSFAIRVDRLDQVPWAISRMQAGGAAHRAALLTAVYHGRIAHMELQRSTGAGLLKRFIAGAQLPELILVGDDDYASTGPAGWRQTSRLMRWARRIIVHAAGGEADQYRGFVDIACKVGRVLLIETDAAHAEAWVLVALAQGTHQRICVILPTQGTHPICPSGRESH